MLFDRLCAIVERHYPNVVLARLLRDAKLFEFPGRIHEKLNTRAWNSLGGAEFLAEHFFLPFPVVAIEDTASCVVIADDVPGQKGLNVGRIVIEIADMRTDPEEMGRMRDKPEEVEAWRRFTSQPGLPQGASSVVVSKLLSCSIQPEEERASKTGTGLVFGGVSDVSFIATKDAMVLDPWKTRVLLTESGAIHSQTTNALGNAVAALEEIMYFNTPKHFIVEREAARPRRKGVKGLPPILRTHERPSFILLEPHEIRERFGIPDEIVNERKTPTPHARRRHYRTLSSDRYTSKQGSVVVVNASWVGPEEGTFKGRNYKVRLDL